MEYKFPWLIRRDMPAVMAIEQLGSSIPWNEEQLVLQLRKRNTIGLVVTDEERDAMSPAAMPIFGYVVYELNKERLHIMRLCVGPASRRRGVAAAGISRLKSKLRTQRRRLLTADVHESQLAVQLTLAHCGFVATGMDGEVIRFEYQTTASLQAVREDGYGEWTT